MSVKNALKLMFLFAVCGLVFIGCAKKPKIDLSGLNGNQNANAEADNDSWGGGYDDGSAAAGDWGGLDEAVKGSSASDFLVDAQRWNDVVYFAYDRSEVSASERPKIEALASYLQSNPGTGIVIEGNCDERGSDEYNRALSERRALSVLDYLKTLGIEESRMVTVSYGEDRPVVQNAQTEAEHSQNRRAEFLFGKIK